MPTSSAGCVCPETSVLRKRERPIPAQHSCAYVKGRNLIVDAVYQSPTGLKRLDGESFATFYSRETLWRLGRIESECAKAILAGRL